MKSGGSTPVFYFCFPFPGLSSRRFAWIWWILKHPLSQLTGSLTLTLYSRSRPLSLPFCHSILLHHPDFSLLVGLRLMKPTHNGTHSGMSRCVRMAEGSLIPTKSGVALYPFLRTVHLDCFRGMGFSFGTYRPGSSFHPLGKWPRGVWGRPCRGGSS